jgi:hypothetical protein
MIFSLEQSIPERLKSQFRELFVRTLSVVTVLYISFGASGYLSFGPRTKGNNEGISAASFCHQRAALVPDMFCNFYFVKNYKIADNSATTEAREKISTDLLESLEFKKYFDVCLVKFENYQILLNKISLRFLVTTKLFSGRKSLIGSTSFHRKPFGRQTFGRPSVKHDLLTVNEMMGLEMY